MHHFLLNRSKQKTFKIKVGEDFCEPLVGVSKAEGNESDSMGGFCVHVLQVTRVSNRFFPGFFLKG
jgi:hypothetical protein